MDPFKQRAALMRRVTYIADVGILPRWMRIADLLDFVAAVNPSFDREAAVARLAKTDIKLQKQVRTLSKGMNVQLHLALVLASNAELLVLDEPTLGLDILYRQQFYDALLNDFFEEQRTILLTTHEVREIEHILTDVVFIDRGKVVLSSSMDVLADRFIKVVTGKDSVAALGVHNPISQRQTLHGFEFVFADVEPSLLAVYGELSTPNLADLFVAVMGAKT
jgi:ABC-2 type transport system ATP-binding protein